MSQYAASLCSFGIFYCTSSLVSLVKVSMFFFLIFMGSLIHFTSMYSHLLRMFENFNSPLSAIFLCLGSQMSNSRKQQITWLKCLTLHHLAKGKLCRLNLHQILFWRYLIYVIILVLWMWKLIL